MELIKEEDTSKDKNVEVVAKEIIEDVLIEEVGDNVIIEDVTDEVDNDAKSEARS